MFWELYLFAALKELGYSVDFSHNRPDFVVTFPYKFCIEATIARHPKDGTPEWKRWKIGPEELEKWSVNKVVDHATLRLANAITQKIKYYHNSYSKLSYVQGKPFVIAITPFDQPFFMNQHSQSIRRVLYGYDRPILIDDETEEYVDLYMKQIIKHNGSLVSLGFFLNPDNADISVVIFSNVATFGKVRVLSKDRRPILVNDIHFNKDRPNSFHGRKRLKDYYETLLDGVLCVS